MLGVLCARPKPWILASLSLATHHNRLTSNPVSLIRRQPPRRHHSTACRIGDGAASSIWHAILPSGGVYSRPALHHEPTRGEGSWNVACDCRPARWLHRSDSAWLLFGVCACLAKPFENSEVCVEAVVAGRNVGSPSSDVVVNELKDGRSVSYRVTGVTADGRCLFRALAHMACLRNGKEAPDENRQKELADDLRAQVVEELLRRRKESEWFIEGDFDAYVKRIQQPYIWGGEPELFMASHVLKIPIYVFMIHRSSGSLLKIAEYGEEYQKDKQEPITILFHGYGHYDILELVSDRNHNCVAA